jgi:hypothetical protein
MHSQLMFAFISKDNFPESRIREISDMLRQQENCIFIVTTPSENSFEHYVKELGEGLTIYNQGDYLAPSKLLETLWGFKAIWIFYADSTEHFDLSECLTISEQNQLEAVGKIFELAQSMNS